MDTKAQNSPDPIERAIPSPRSAIIALVHRITRRVLGEANKFIILLMAAVTLYGTLVAFLQVHANVKSAEYTREEKTRAILALLLKVNGLLGDAYDTETTRTYVELRNRAALAARETETRGFSPEASLARSRAVERLLGASDSLIDQSQVLRQPYFKSTNLSELKPSGGDPKEFFRCLNKDLNAGEPDLYAYEQRMVFGPSLLVNEEREAYGELVQAWSRKASAYQTIIPLIAVSLFLYALALTVDGKLKSAFVYIGSGNVVVLAAWTLVTALLPAPRISGEALRSYVDGYVVGVNAYDANFSNLYDKAITKADEAIVKLDRAIKLKPNYAKAYETRANCYLSKGEAMFMKRAAPAARDAALLHSKSDFTQALRLDPERVDSYWNMAWIMYLLGDYTGCADFYRQVIVRSPEQQFGAHLERSLALLALGKAADAEAEVRQAIDRACKTPLVTDYDYYRSTIRILRRLQTIRPHPGMDTMELLMKQAFASVQYRGTPEPGQTSAMLNNLAFSSSASGQDENQKKAVFPYGTEQVHVRFDYEGLRNGEQLVIRVYQDDVDNYAMTQFLIWRDGAAGLSNRLVIKSELEPTLKYLDAGKYDVEIFIEGNSKAQGSFTIAES